mgnify:CR=1 FL=1
MQNILSAHGGTRDHFCIIIGPVKRRPVKHFYPLGSLGGSHHAEADAAENYDRQTQ